MREREREKSRKGKGGLCDPDRLPLRGSRRQQPSYNLTRARRLISYNYRNGNNIVFPVHRRLGRIFFQYENWRPGRELRLMTGLDYYSQTRLMMPPSSSRSNQ